MGLFSSLFGKAGSDKADKMRQAAIEAFTAIKTPELKDLQIQLAKYVSVGRLTPAQAEAELLQSNAFNDIVTDPALEGAQKQALSALQNIGTQGGLTAIDKARMADITSEQGQVARSRNEAIMSQAQERGMGGSNMSTINQLMNEQSTADRASRRGTEVAANAEARALQALMAGGQMATGIRAQDYGEQANRAGTQNAIDLFNTQTLNQTNLYNIDAANRAGAANLANEQKISNINTGTTNEQARYNAQQHQQVFQNEMGKAKGIVGTYNKWADDASAAAKEERQGDAKLLGGAIQAIAPAFKNPFSKASPNFTPKNPTETRFDFDYKTGNYSEGGRVPGHSNGGQIPGVAPVPGNSPINDTVPANLSPGEVIIPRTAMSDDEEFDAFMNKFRPSKRNKQADLDKPLIDQALSSLSARMTRIEGR